MHNAAWLLACAYCRHAAESAEPSCRFCMRLLYFLLIHELKCKFTNTQRCMAACLCIFQTCSRICGAELQILHATVTFPVDTRVECNANLQMHNAAWLSGLCILQTSSIICGAELQILHAIVILPADTRVVMQV